MRITTTYRAAAGLAIAAAQLFSQPATNAKPTFDVASVKPSAAGSRQQLTIQPGGRLSLNGFSVETLIAISYRLPAFQIVVPDGWMKVDRWAIEAKAEEVASVPAWAPPYLPEVIATRLRALLEERFSLQAHREMREMKAYVLALAKGGAKLEETEPPLPAVSMAAGPGVLVASAVTMDQIVTYLNRIMDLPVIDKTGLTGHYNFKLKFAPESHRPLSAPPSSPEGTETGDPSIFVALREQLGLEVKPSREDVDVLVIDSARRPSAN
jgi:uncharacterized protein (TIGR03435 family)